jgi:hypothetical protein
MMSVRRSAAPARASKRRSASDVSRGARNEKPFAIVHVARGMTGPRRPQGGERRQCHASLHSFELRVRQQPAGRSVDPPLSTSHTLLRRYSRCQLSKCLYLVQVLYPPYTFLVSNRRSTRRHSSPHARGQPLRPPAPPPFSALRSSSRSLPSTNRPASRTQCQRERRGQHPGRRRHRQVHHEARDGPAHPKLLGAPRSLRCACFVKIREALRHFYVRFTTHHFTVSAVRRARAH